MHLLGIHGITNAVQDPGLMGLLRLSDRCHLIRPFICLHFVPYWPQRRQGFCGHKVCYSNLGSLGLLNTGKYWKIAWVCMSGRCPDLRDWVREMDKCIVSLWKAIQSPEQSGNSRKLKLGPCVWDEGCIFFLGAQGLKCPHTSHV